MNSASNGQHTGRHKLHLVLNSLDSFADDSRSNTYLDFVALASPNLLKLAWFLCSNIGSIDPELCSIDLPFVGFRDFYYIFRILDDRRRAGESLLH